MITILLYYEVSILRKPLNYGENISFPSIILFLFETKLHVGQYCNKPTQEQF
jgi:hypothetical protein